MTAKPVPNVLSIAGSDPSGGAGIQADLKTFAAHRVYGMAVPAALTAQNTLGVTDTFTPPAAFLSAQLKAIFADVRVDAVKIGMLGTADAAHAVADALSGRKRGAVPLPVVLDPVTVSSSGRALLDDAGIAILKERLLPLCDVVTPNLPEAALLTGRAVDETKGGMEAAARAILKMGAGAVLLTGGHGKGGTVTDLYCDGGDVRVFANPRIATKNTHGTGCAVAAALACRLALGDGPALAAEGAVGFVRGALAAADALSVGKGTGPINHLGVLWKD